MLLLNFIATSITVLQSYETVQNNWMSHGTFFLIQSTHNAVCSRVGHVPQQVTYGRIAYICYYCYNEKCILNNCLQYV